MILYILWPAIFDPDVRRGSELQEYFWWADYITNFLSDTNDLISKIAKHLIDIYFKN